MKLKQGFFQLGRGGGVGGWEGKFVSVCKACGKLWQTGGILPLETFHFGPFIRRNLVESGTFSHKHNLPFIVSLKA